MTKSRLPADVFASTGKPAKASRTKKAPPARASATSSTAKPTGRPRAKDLAGVEPVRVTCYFRPDQHQALLRAVGERMLKGERADVSQVVREAVDVLLLKKGSR